MNRGLEANMDMMSESLRSGRACQYRASPPVMPVLWENKSTAVAFIVTSDEVLWKWGRESRIGEDQSARPWWTSEA